MGAWLLKAAGRWLTHNLPVVLIVALAALTWHLHQRVQRQAETLGQTGAQLAALTEDNQTLVGLINDYGQQLRRLASAQTEIRGALAARTRDIGALARDNPQFRD